MIFFNATSKPTASKAIHNLWKIAFVAFLALLWGCIPVLQKASTAPPPAIDTDSTYRLAAFLEETNGISLSKIVAEDLELSIDEELEPLAR